MEGAEKHYLGDTQQVSFYKNGKKEGLEKTFRNGKLFQTTPYKNGKRVGIQKTYNNGKLYTTTPYKNGEKNGIEKTYGIQYTTTPYKNGEKNGIEKTYDHGKLYKTTPYINGERNGIGKVYYHNGQVEQEKHWKSEQRIGTWKSYTLNGPIETVEVYERGRLVKGVQYFEDGTHGQYSKLRMQQTNTFLIDQDKETKKIRKMRRDIILRYQK